MMASLVGSTASITLPLKAQVVRYMRAIRGDLQVARGIVEAIVVFVVDVFVWQERPSKFLGHHLAVFQNVPFADANVNVAVAEDETAALPVRVIRASHIGTHAFVKEAVAHSVAEFAVFGNRYPVRGLQVTVGNGDVKRSATEGTNNGVIHMNYCNTGAR